MDRLAFLAGAALGLVAPRALLGGTPVALVTADLESSVVAYELPGLRRLRSIRTSELPRAIEQVGNVAVVAHSELGLLTLVDGADLVVRKVLRGFREPRYTAASHDGRHAFVTDSGSGEVAVVDVLAGRTVARVDVGGPARHVSLNLAGRRLWVALGMKARHVAVVDVADPRRPRLVRRFRPPWLAHDVGFATRDRVWVTSGSERELALYDPRTGELVKRLSAGEPPQHVTFLGGAAFVTSGDDGTLERRGIRDGFPTSRRRIPLGSYNVQEAGGLVLTPSLSSGTLSVADRHGRVIRRVRAARSSHDACFVMAR
ncbi:MAG: hypothetical protein ICV67_03300 [Thermoleophilia bacterium]|nr:hypothetical protein [Thermoleophilia bacterium]